MQWFSNKLWSCCTLSNDMLSNGCLLRCKIINICSSFGELFYQFPHHHEWHARFTISMFGGAYGDARMPNWPHRHRTPLPEIATSGLRCDKSKYLRGVLGGCCGEGFLVNSCCPKVSRSQARGEILHITTFRHIPLPMVCESSYLFISQHTKTK